MAELVYPDETAASSTATEELEDTAAGGVTPDEDPDSKVPFHEHPRWKEVHGELKAFKALGATPEQILDLGREVQFYRELDARNKQDQRQEKREPTEEEQEQEAQLKAARTALERVAPELKELGQLKQILAKIEKQDKERSESIDEQARGTLTSLMAKEGLRTDAEKVVSMTKRVNLMIQDDPKLLRLYTRDPSAAVTQAWGDYMADIDLIASRRSGARLEQKGSSLASLPRAQQGGGGAAATKGQAPAQTIDELFKRERGVLTGKG